MALNIHPTAIVSNKAEIADNVTIGPYSIIEDNVFIDEGTELIANVFLSNGSRIGKECKLFPGAVVGTAPQDLKFGGEVTLATVGDRTVIREFATIHRGTLSTGKTTVGSDCLLMAYTHVAHDCRVGNNVIMSNTAQIAGHVTIEDWVIFGAFAKVHQFCRIGCHCMLGADSTLLKDVPPYVLIGHVPLKIESLNRIGLKRRGFSEEEINDLDEFYRFILRSGHNISDGLTKFEERGNISDNVMHCIDFIRNSKRGIYN